LLPLALGCGEFCDAPASRSSLNERSK
jgi:hypothetical protein